MPRPHSDIRGKSRAVKHILPLIPEDITELCSPFLGVGRWSLLLLPEGHPSMLTTSSSRLCGSGMLCSQTRSDWLRDADAYRLFHFDYGCDRGLHKRDFIRLRNELRDATEFSFLNAAKFYAINRSSFPGATFSGGYSKRILQALH